MEFYEAANVEEAVELANKLKDEGKYNWFRGQVQDWPPISSHYRVQTSGDAEKKEKSAQRVKMFSYWVSTIPELQYLQVPERVNDFYAILQHYGIPTNYIDFTTDPGVAGFFAADTKNPPTDGMSCIYCLNTNELMSFWNIIKDFDERKEMMIELVEIDVQNLWRLQAQNGVFLLTNFKWDIDYPMDRIVFPYSGYPSYPTRERIYPEHKSPLEQRLDEYFLQVSIEFGNEWMEECGYLPGTIRLEAVLGGFNTKAFINTSRLVSFDSWSREVIRPWEIDPVEDYHQTIGPTQMLKLNPQASVEEIRKSVGFGVKQIVRSDPTIRSKAVDWVCTGLPESLSQEDLTDMLRPVWNGMRRLPYADSEIADAFGSVAALLMLGFSSRAAYEDQMKLFSQCFSECVLVEFGYEDNTYSRGLVAQESLRKALRPDMAELLAPTYKDGANDFNDLFLIIYNPRLMFEFNEFKGIFAREIIPAQVVMGRDLIIFDPTPLETFGLH
jgi:hypothetical protein